MEKKIAQLLKLEEKARAIQAKQDDNETKWKALFDKLKDTPEFAAYCKEKGFYPHYSYGDVLC